jgi:DNA-binding IclR family transcriptional regulator
MSTDPYRTAQLAIAELKAAVLEVISRGPESGLKNAEIGRALGIYRGHEGHEGHISRTLLAMLEEEGVVRQDEDKRWSLRT